MNDVITTSSPMDAIVLVQIAIDLTCIHTTQRWVLSLAAHYWPVNIYLITTFATAVPILVFIDITLYFMELTALKNPPPEFQK